MSCKYCQSEKGNVSVTIGEWNLSYCPDCNNFDYKSCEHVNNQVVKYKQGERWYVKNLCIDCQTLNGMFLKQVDHDFDKLRVIDKLKYDNYKLILSKNFNDLITPIRYKRDDWQKEHWFKEHGEYLSSQKWKEKRSLVLERDGYLCQSCMVNKATEVHHLNYKHKGNEPLFDLVSICHECHELITLMDRKIEI